jgi:SAM-dependent methyltransferase
MTAQETYARFAQFYDAYIADYAADIPFYLAAVADVRLPLLEVGCGTGRVLAALLQAGHDVTGVDISEAMLALAKIKLGQTRGGDKCRLLLHDFAQGSLSGEFGAALITFYTFNYILPEQHLVFLQNIGRNLTKGAPIVMHLFYPAALAHPELDGVWQAKGRYQVEGKEVALHDCRRMINSHTEHRRQRYETDSGTADEIQTMRYYLPPTEMAGLLSNAGFSRIRVAFDLQYEHLQPFTPLDAQGGEYMMVAERMTDPD